MTKITGKQIAEMELGYAVKSSVEVIENAAQRMEQAAQELRRYAARIKEGDGSAKRSDIMSWAINTITSVFPNLRVDMFGTRAADLARAELLGRLNADG